MQSIVTLINKGNTQGVTMNRLHFLPKKIQTELASTVALIDDVYGHQKRRFTDELASQHLFDVAANVATVTKSRTVLLGALLHDIVEDQPDTKFRVFYQYDDRTNELVRILTKPVIQEGESREERNLRYWRAVATDSEALLIKLADLIANIPGSAEPEHFRRRFIQEKSQFLALVRNAAMKSASTKRLFAQAEAAMTMIKTEGQGN